MRQKLVRETEWNRVYESEAGVRLHESKFLVDGLGVSLEQVTSRWSTFSEVERLDFANAFGAKPNVSAEDERILDYLMEVGDSYTWMAIAPLLPRHRNRERVLEFLLNRIREEGKDNANFFQALRMIRDRRAVAGLRTAYERYRREQKSGKVGLYDLDFLGCCAALLAIDGAAEYRRAIQDASNSPDELVRRYAKFAWTDEGGQE